MEAKNYVTFYAPGEFVLDRVETQEIEGWDIERAKERAKDLIPRPYAFQFSSSMGDEADKSPIYYLGGELITLETAEAQKLEILAWNMRVNKWNWVVKTPHAGYRHFDDGANVVLNS